MSRKIQLPPGCIGFTSADGTKSPEVRQGTSVTISDEHASRLRKSAHASIGMITVDPGTVIGTKGGRVCVPCGGRRWQAWSLECPRCGSPTVPE
jgi:hypothetical protein